MTTPQQPQESPPAVRYYRLPNGSVTRWSTSGTSDEVPPRPGAVQITASEYETLLAQANAQAELLQQQAREAELQNLANALAELVGIGLSEATARLVLRVAPGLDLPPAELAGGAS